jgi:hypothetical protein
MHKKLARRLLFHLPHTVITLTKEWRQWQPSRLGEDEIELRTIKEKDDPCHPTLRRIEAEVGNL